jgi:hypothetical protein
MPTLPLIEYSVTRPFTLPYFSVIVSILGIFWIAVITILNVAAVGYDAVPVYSTSFNSSTLLWYEKSALISWLFPPSWSCDPAIIEPGEGITSWCHS